MNNKMRKQDKTPSGGKWHYDFNLLIYRVGQSLVASFLLFLFVSVAWTYSCIVYPDFPEVYAAVREDTEARIENRILEDPIFLNALLGSDPENAVPISDEQVKHVQTKADDLAKRLQSQLVKESVLTAYLEETEETSSPKDSALAPELNSASDSSVTESAEEKSPTEPVETAPEEEQAETAVTRSEAITEDESVDYFDVPLSESLQSYIYELAEEYDIPAALIIAVIDQESQFDSDSISATNDYGLMQINEINFGWLQEHFGSTIDFLDPFQNVEAGTYMLSELYHKYPESIHLALMAYNMGEGGARKQWESGVYSSDYSRSVAELYEFYKG